MIYGLSEDGGRVRAARGVSAVCPCCGGTLTAKCGAIVAHHWAHREAGDCAYARGMTQWHYDWLVAYEQLGRGWEIERWYDSTVRFDAYHAGRRQAIEFQRVVDAEYIRRKVQLCRAAGIRLFWLMHPEVFRNFVYSQRFEGAAREVLFSPGRRRRPIMDVLAEHCGRGHAAFLVDFRDERRLPRYYADGYRSTAANGYRACLERDVHPMETGVYRIARVLEGQDRYFMREYVLEVRRQRRRYGL